MTCTPHELWYVYNIVHKMHFARVQQHIAPLKIIQFSWNALSSLMFLIGESNFFLLWVKHNFRYCSFKDSADFIWFTLSNLQTSASYISITIFERLNNFRHWPFISHQSPSRSSIISPLWKFHFLSCHFLFSWSSWRNSFLQRD